MTAYPRSLVRSTAAPPERRQYRSATTLTMRAVDTLPAGVVGQVEGIALVYDVVDSYGTTFARGCIDRTARERVAAGKVRLFLDHGDMPSQGMYDTHLHIGVVRELVDEQGADGRWHARFRADLFDTEAGREAHEYLRAIAATGSETGVSIGMLKEPATTRAVIDGTPCHRIAEITLGEISITSMSSVPGTRVTAVRAAVGDETAGAVTAGEEAQAEAVAKSPEPDAPAPVVEAAPPAPTPQPAPEHVSAPQSPTPTPAPEPPPNAPAPAPTTTAHRAFVSESVVAHGGLRVKVTTVSHSPDLPPTVAVELLDPPSPPVDLSSPPNYFALLDGLVAHLGIETVRAHLGATVSNACGAYSDAGAERLRSNTPDSLGADSQDSSGVARGGTEPPTPNRVSMVERLAFARTQLHRLYPP